MMLRGFHRDHGFAGPAYFEPRAGLVVDLTMEDACSLRIQPLLDGRPLEDGHELLYCVWDKDLDRSYQGRLRPGYWVIEHLPVGALVVSVIVPDLEVYAEEQVDLLDSGAYEIRPTLLAGVVIGGTVESALPSPMNDLTVCAVNASTTRVFLEKWCQSRVLDNGRFSLLVPGWGSIELEARRNGVPLARTAIDSATSRSGVVLRIP
jgi:hypothetical protein